MPRCRLRGTASRHPDRYEPSRRCQGQREPLRQQYPPIGMPVSRILVSPMDMTWLGHACFRMRGREGIVLTDPPDPKSGHAIPRTEAGLVTMSHDDPGHASLRSVAGEPVVLRGPGEYEVHEALVTGISSFHDDENGAARG